MNAAWPSDLDDLAAVVAARLRADGSLAAANRGFRRLLERYAVSAADLFRQPPYARLAAAEPGAGGVVFAGFLTVGDGGGSDVSLRGTVRADGADRVLVAEFDPEDFDRTARAVGRLNHELAEAQRRLVFELREKERAEGDRDASRSRVEELSREVAVLHALAGGPQAGGLPALTRSSPAAFHDLAGAYGRLLDMALEQRAYRVSHPVGDGLRELAGRVGMLGGGARDVIELHALAFRERVRDAPPAKRAAYLEEGRLLVLELMGELLGHYRRLALAPRRRPPGGV